MKNNNNKRNTLFQAAALEEGRASQLMRTHLEAEEQPRGFRSLADVMRGCTKGGCCNWSPATYMKFITAILSIITSPTLAVVPTMSGAALLSYNDTKAAEASAVGSFMMLPYAVLLVLSQEKEFGANPEQCTKFLGLNRAGGLSVHVVLSIASAVASAIVGQLILHGTKMDSGLTLSQAAESAAVGMVIYSMGGAMAYHLFRKDDSIDIPEPPEPVAPSSAPTLN